MATLVSCALISAVRCGGSMSARTAVGDSSGNIHEVLADVTALTENSLVLWSRDKIGSSAPFFPLYVLGWGEDRTHGCFPPGPTIQRVLGQEFIYGSVTWLPLGLVDHSSVLDLGGSISVWSQYLINLSKFGKCPQIPSRKAWMNIFSTHQQLVEAVLGGIFPYD